ncbi:hypothetical protein [Aquimarina pacifica]|uniref:hypothetical protein n=1 Tax=Aquimarina pacifica TaxID=1296415 RepID=UPI0004B6FD74|nr:hypothetical protein [Aquimarina pacifica]
MDAGERILMVIDFLKISKNKFSTKILGLSASTKIDHIIKGRNQLTADFASIICRAVPEINYEWLLRGNGEMLKDTNKSLLDIDDNATNIDINNLAFMAIKYEDELMKNPLFKKMIERHSLIMLNDKMPELIDRIYKLKS